MIKTGRLDINRSSGQDSFHYTTRLRLGFDSTSAVWGKVAYLKIVKKEDQDEDEDVSQKRDVCNFANNFGKCWPIFKIVSLLHSELNLQQLDYFIVQHSLNV